MNVQVHGIREAIASATLAGQPKARQWGQQAVNRQGALEVGRSVKELRAGPLPVKSKYLRARVKWRKLSSNGTGGFLRYLGAGKFRGSGHVRPRHANLQFPTAAPARDERGRFKAFGGNLAAGKLRNQARKAAAVSYGVGGLIPKRSVLGFVMSVHEGPTFRQAWQDGFMKSRAQVFKRTGHGRLPISKDAGVTVGTAAKSIGLPQRAGERIAERSVAELAARIDRETKAAARGSFRGGGG